MPADAMRSDVKILMSQIEHERDTRQAYLKLREHMDRYRRRGDVIPVEIVRLEKDLALACCNESQGR
jgi:hypothetical protein